MFSDRVVDLIEAGVITNRFKRPHTGRISTTFVNGSRKLYDSAAVRRYTFPSSGRLSAGNEAGSWRVQ
jgi:acyl-CoA hydrolase